MASTDVTPRHEYEINPNLTSIENLTMSLGNNSDITSGRNDPMVTFTVPAIMFATGVIGNILAILVLLRSSQEHKQTVFYRLVGALACTDLFGTCAISPVTLAVYANKLKWVGGAALCEYESFMMVFASYSTILIVSTMAVDRFVAINCPFVYDKHISYEKVKYYLIGVWGFAALMGLFPILGFGDNVKQFPGTWCFFTFTSSELKNKIYVYSYATIALTLVAVTAVSNVFVTLTLLKMRQKALRTMNICNAKRTNSELQMMVLMLGIIIIFSTCWCPFMIRLYINQSREKQTNMNADLLTLRLASINQILDPWIYILFRKEMFKRVVRCLKPIFMIPCMRLCPSRDSTTTVTRPIPKNYEVAMGNKDEYQDPATVYLQVDEQERAAGDGNDPTTADQTELFSQRPNGVAKDSDKFCKRVSYTSNGVPDEREYKTSDGKKVVFQRSKSSSAKYSNRSSILSRISDMFSDFDSDTSSTHRCNMSLELKHSTCLFCLSKYPHDFVRAKMGEPDNASGRHKDKVSLSSVNWNDKISNTIQCPSIGKRSSIHLSLAELRTECGSCSHDLRAAD